MLHITKMFTGDKIQNPAPAAQFKYSSYYEITFSTYILSNVKQIMKSTLQIMS